MSTMSQKMSLRETIIETGETFDVEQEFTGENELNMDVDIAESTTDQEETIGIDVSKLQVIQISATCTITLKTNSSTEPDQTLTVTVGIPIPWHTGMIYDNPLTVDVVKIFLTTEAGQTGKLRIKGLVA